MGGKPRARPGCGIAVGARHSRRGGLALGFQNEGHVALGSKLAKGRQICYNTRRFQADLKGI